MRGLKECVDDGMARTVDDDLRPAAAQSVKSLLYGWALRSQGIGVRGRRT